MNNANFQKIHVVPLAVSTVEAAKLLGIGKTLLYVKLASGDLRSCKIGRRRVVPISAIQEFLKAREAAPDGIGR